ncbi:hypothetical protein [Micromonospora sp. NPDC048839]|uniref:hypothetical protein n=1 Tax=Micromonospora sp. NPDC048839 TaxID=3155641 RepID=UPI0033BFD9E7
MIYRTDDQERLVGIFVMDAGLGQAILWDHRARVWAYDPDLVVRFLDDYRNVGRYKSVSRAAVEAVVEAVTGGEKLPDESSIRAMFRVGSNSDR